MQSWSQYVGLLALASLLLYRGFVWVFTTKPLKGIPHTPQSGKLFGDLPEIIRIFKQTGSQIRFFDECYEKYGGLFQVSLGIKRIIVVNDPTLIQDVAVKRSPSEFDRDALSLAVFGVLTPNGQLAVRSGDVFRAHRRAIAPAIGSAHLSNSTYLITQSAMELVELWKKKMERSDGKAFSAKDDLFSCFTDTLGRVVLGSPFGCLESIRKTCEALPKLPFDATGKGCKDLHAPIPDFYEHADYMNEHLGNALVAPFPKLSVMLQSFTPRWQRAKRFVRRYLKARIDEARERALAAVEKQEVSSVLEMLADKEAKGKLNMDNDEIVDEMYILLFGGSDTTATTLAWGLKILTKHPDFQKELYAYLKERLAPIDEKVPTHADVSDDRVPLLTATAYELIRLSRTTSGGARTPVQDTTIAGHFVPKGSLVLLATNSTLYEKEPSESYDEAEVRKLRGCGYWKDADPSSFDPKRWLAEDGSFDRTAGPFAPFGMGTRGCWGRSMAILQMKLFVAILTMTFSFESVPDELALWDATVNMVTKPNFCYIRPILR